MLTPVVIVTVCRKFCYMIVLAEVRWRACFRQLPVVQLPVDSQCCAASRPSLQTLYDAVSRAMTSIVKRAMKCKHCDACASQRACCWAGACDGVDTESGRYILWYLFFVVFYNVRYNVSFTIHNTGILYNWYLQYSSNNNYFNSSHISKFVPRVCTIPTFASTYAYTEITTKVIATKAMAIERCNVSCNHYWKMQDDHVRMLHVYIVHVYYFAYKCFS